MPRGIPKKRLDIRIELPDAADDDLVANALNATMLVWAPLIKSNDPRTFCLARSRYAVRVVGYSQDELESGTAGGWRDVTTGKRIA